MPRTPLVSLTDQELTARFHGGERLALETLIDRYRRFARAKSRGYFVAGGDANDVEQEALIGLYKAARDFRPELEVPFRAFAELCITRQVISAVKAATRNKHQVLNRSVPLVGVANEEAGERSLEAVLADPRQPDPADQLVRDEGLRSMRLLTAERLSALEVEVLDLFVAGFSYLEIAQRLGRGTKAIDNALQRIKHKLEPALAA